jgi:signal transduction histidine kinase
MLHFFYQGARFNEMKNISADLSKNFDNENKLLLRAQDKAEEYNSDIWIYRISDGDIDSSKKIAYFEGTRDSVGYHLEANFDQMYRNALDNDGKYTAMVLMKNFENSYFDFQIINDNLGEPNSFPYVSGSMQHLHVISINVYDAGDANMVIIQCSSITPLGTMINTLENQAIIIAILLVVFTLILAALMAKLITKPIEQINKSAKSLAIGVYDIEFSGRGYREIDELSDTLNYASKELAKNDRLKKELISNVSHDLRTPLTLIKGYSEVIRDIPEENTPQNLQIIIDETERLSELVSDMLDLSTLQAGARNPDMQEFCLTDLIRSTMYRYEKLIMQNGYAISFDATGDVYVVADSTMILQVIYNLINNAINYSGSDKRVTVTQTTSDDLVRISISDSGEGIAQEDIPFIWDRYYKVDKVHKRATVGTGLGLSIVKQILELHNATYGVTSAPGMGSTFWFELKTSDSDEYKVEVVEI